MKRYGSISQALWKCNGTLTRHALGHFSSEMRDRSDLATEIEALHEDIKHAAMKRDEQQVNNHI
jgi:hypothetical protein